MWGNTIIMETKLQLNLSNQSDSENKKEKNLINKENKWSLQFLVPKSDNSRPTICRLATWAEMGHHNSPSFQDHSNLFSLQNQPIPSMILLPSPSACLCFLLFRFPSQTFP